jgi:hypothetical protein
MKLWNENECPLVSSNPGPDSVQLFSKLPQTPTPPSNFPKDYFLHFKVTGARVLQMLPNCWIGSERYTKFFFEKKDPQFLFSIAMAME